MDFQNGRRQANPVFSVPVTFDGGLQSNVRARLIIELIKYLLYERQQLPSPFDFVKKDVKQLNEEKSSQQKTKMVSSRNRVGCKSIEAVKSLDETFAELLQAFEFSPEIKQVAMLLGATPFSPKEVYLVELPPLNPDADNIPVKTCIQTLFRQLILQDPLSKLKEMRPTNLMLLVQAPRESRLSWFYPKPLYKLPASGRQFHIQLQCKCGSGDHNLSKGWTVVDISGVEPFDLSCCDTSQETLSTSMTDSFSSDFTCTDSDSDLVQSSSSSINSQDVTAINVSDAFGNKSTASTSSVDISAIKSDKSSTDSGSSSSKSDTLCSVQNTSGSSLCSVTNASSCSLVCDGKPRMAKSRSASSILMQGSVLSQSGWKSAANEMNDHGQPGTSCQGTSRMDSELIWFQSPLVVKGYINKVSGKP